jgi:hypothetical protein
LYLEIAEEERIDITHNHGIPYFVNAVILGGVKIIQERAGETVAIYNEDTIPHI